MSALAFPFSRLRFGFKRTALPGARRPGQNRRGPALSSDENRRLSRLAAAIPGSFRGYAVENADTLTKLILDSNELLAQATIEPPAVRSQVNSWTSRRSAWGADHDNALREIQNEVSVAAFVDAFREATGLTEAAMENRLLWIGLREPVAGELIIPRKTRRGLKVHLNPYAWNRQGRQVRISSNFVTFIDCCATDNNTDRETASQLIAAFLLSSFGQLQFEMSGYNREGCLSLEANQLREFSVFDPRLVAPDERAAILATLHGLPFPLEMNQLASGKPEQRLLDGHIARTLCRLYRWDEPDRLVNDVEALLDEYVLARG